MKMNFYRISKVPETRELVINTGPLLALIAGIGDLGASGGRTSDYKFICHAKLVKRSIEDCSIEGKEPKAIE